MCLWVRVCMCVYACLYIFGRIHILLLADVHLLGLRRRQFLDINYAWMYTHMCVCLCCVCACLCLCVRESMRMCMYLAEYAFYSWLVYNFLGRRGGIASTYTMCKCIQTHVCVYVYVCVCVYMFSRQNTALSRCTLCVNVYTHVRVCVCVCLRVCMCVYIYVCVYLFGRIRHSLDVHHV